MAENNIKKFVFSAFILALCTLCTALLPSPSFAALQVDTDGKRILRWGGDSDGGFPYMFPDPENPGKIIGFEVDIVDEIAKIMNAKPVYTNNAWDNLIPGLESNIYDIAIDGLEVTPEHEETINFSVPYYKTFLQLAVRKDDNSIRTLEDLKGKKAGTLKESYAQEVLEEVGDIKILTYIVEANTYEDLTNGRLDAAFFDHPIAMYSAGFNPEVKFIGPPVGEITYAIAVRKADKELLSEINKALIQLRDNGKLREIYDRWNLWTPMMANMFNDFDPQKVEHTRYDEWAETHRPVVTLAKRVERYSSLMPLFLKGALVTLEVSIVSMLLAMSLGLLLALARVFAPLWISAIAVAIIEFIRGTPLLIQLFFIYYGLTPLGIKLSPFAAGALGLGINYAAYEAEIYRAGLFAIPHTQWEAALALGMTRWQAMREVILPQAVRVVIPPITNDFISLLKDSSLVSMITMVDLAKVFTQVSGVYYDYFGPGIIVAVIYLVIGLPFVRFARHTEQKLAQSEKNGSRNDNIYRRSTKYI